MKQSKEKHYILRILNVILLWIGIQLSCGIFAANEQSGIINSQIKMNAIYASQAKTDPTQNSPGRIPTEQIWTQQAIYLAQQLAIEKVNDKVNTKRKSNHEDSLPKLGDHFGGGIVFKISFMDQKAWIVALVDQSSRKGITWTIDNILKETDGARSVENGKSNTKAILAALGGQDKGNYAASIAANYRVQDDGNTSCTGIKEEICHDDWYLPSIDELSILYNMKESIGNFSLDPYWSSTEYDKNDAIIKFFHNGKIDHFFKNSKFKIRAIREHSF